ncbi:MlaD family protein [Desulfobotulus sp. H1]|uniref:MlaD family protein n=1 Tax=Desulfobotulus pelophilus TaxID=2823377 RepID=A0ABT3NB33_9BACT|nr:MlaD family protein [Desulfobotulus pelophilus]MCW7754673.1 MlaD family protein [Desulfobotulus pelophilus]
MNLNEPELPDITTAKARFWIWLIPIAAMIGGGWLLFQHYAQRGILISITFETASGLVAGKTQLRFKDLTIGIVESLDLTQNLSHVNVHVRVDRSMQPHISEDSRFWVVRPRIDRHGISGLNTLLSGAYIAMEPGTGKPATTFTGLENPPITSPETPGLRLVLETDSGGVDVGTTIYYRKIPVGTVEARTVLPDPQRILLDVFIRSPYDAHVNQASRFWRDSGIDFSLSAEGIRFHTESLETLFAGGIAFDNPDPSAAAVKNSCRFHLFPSYRDIRSQSMQMGLPFVLYFDSSVRGLTPGAPVEFRGVQVGEVLDIDLLYDREAGKIRIPVTISILPEELLGNGIPDAEALLMEMLQTGLKARLDVGNLLTGQLYVSMEMDDSSAYIPQQFNDEGFPVIATMPHPIEKITESALSLLHRIGELPIEGIAENTIHALQSAQRLMAEMETLPKNIGPILTESQEVLETIQKTLENLQSGLHSLQPGSSLYMEISRAAQELSDSARAVRIFAESLEARPDMLIHGK